MKHIIVIILFICSNNCSSQTWFAPGAEWIYEYSLLPITGYLKLNYEKDTIINQHQCKKLSYRKITKKNYSTQIIDTSSISSIYTYATKDTVFATLHDSTFIPLYIFNKEVGDTLNFEYYALCYTQTPIKQLITEKGIKIINNDTLRYYSVQFINISNINPAFMTIIEKIGPIENFLNPTFSCWSDYQITTLKCYHDANFPDYLAPFNKSCNYYFTATEEVKDNPVYLSPNPAYNTLNISTSNNEIIEGVYIYDISGMLLNSYIMPLNQNDSSIDINYLKNGMYLIQIKTADGKSIIKKFIKQA